MSATDSHLPTPLTLKMTSPQDTQQDEVCARCGAEMKPFVWGIKNEDTCKNCGFKHPCCE